MSDLFIALSIFYLLIILGYILGKLLKNYNEQIRKILSFILLFILTPPIIIFSFLLPDFSINTIVILNIIILTFILIFATQFIAYIFFLRKRNVDDNKRVGAILNLVAIPNAMLFPLPIVLSLFGSQFIIILVIFALTTIAIRVTWFVYLNIYYGENRTISYKDILKNIFTFPPTIALILSIILLSLGITLDCEFFITTNDIISVLTTILGAILIGVLIVNINLKKIHEFKQDFLIVIGIRIVFSFILFFLITQFLIFPSENKQTTLTILLLLSVSPPAVANIYYTEYFNLDNEFAAFCVITITILAIIYVPLILILGLTIF